MPTIEREFPNKLRITISLARELHEIAWHAGPDRDSVRSPRLNLFLGFLVILFEHHDSTCLLLETGKNDASAFSLYRILVETTYRGLWSYLCATEEQLDDIRNGGEPYPRRFIEMTAQVDKKLRNTGSLRFSEDVWSSLNSFTHTGSAQLARRYSTIGELIPDYPLDEILALIGLATGYLAMMTDFYCVLLNRKADAKLIQQVWTKFLNDSDLK